MKDYLEHFAAALIAIVLCLGGYAALTRYHIRAMAEGHNDTIMKVEREKTKQQALEMGCSIAGDVICCAKNR